jgi:uncharacterized protein with FMN-binding domain
MWFMSTLTVVVLLFGYHTSLSGPSGASTATKPVISSTPSAGTPATPSSPRKGGPAGSRANGAGSGPTTVFGPSVNTRWGPVKVAITTSSGKVTAVKVVDYPSGNSTDDQINSYALPVLVRETMDRQSARIDMVSGATITSGGYIRSLQAALDKAGL